MNRDSDTKKAKKPYSTPHLVCYGPLEELTQGSSNDKRDGGPFDGLINPGEVRCT